MRESLTIFAGLLILILTVALIGPYLVDWTAQRGWIEKLLSDATGAEVEVAGAIDVKLLPIPSLRLEKVAMRGAAPGDASFQADRLELQMAVTPLLRGQVQFIEADFEAPELHLTLGADGSLVLPHAPASLPAAMQFSAISLRHGRLTIDDPNQQRRFSLGGLDLAAAADSLTGPFSGSGHVALSGGSAGFRFSTAARAGDRLNLKANVDATATTPAAEFDGALVFADAPGGATRLALDGTAAFAGSLALPGAPGLGWTISGPVEADASRATFKALELRLGDAERALTATGTGEVDFGGAPQAHASLSAQQIDIDNLLAPKDARSAPALLAKTFAGVLADRNFAERMPMPFDLALSSPAVVLGGETLTNLSSKLEIRPGAPLGLTFEADGPGRSHLALAGAVETGSAADFKGHVEASARDKTRLIDWLGAALPDLAGKLRVLPFRSIELAGDMDVSGAGVLGQSLRINVDRSVLAGTISFTKPVGQDRARLFADLSADALDLDGLPDLSGAAAAATNTDLALTLDARAVRLARFGQGMVDAGHIHIKLAKTAAKTVLEDFTLANLGGANVSASGNATPEGLRIQASLDADRLGDLAALLRRVAPGDAADMFAARATALSPAHLELTAAARIANGVPELNALTFNGTARGTEIDATANPDPADAQAISADVTLDSADTPMLLRQLGLETLPLGGFGRGHVGIALSGRLGDDVGAKVDASLAGTDFAFNGRLGGSPSAPHAAGPFTLKSGNLAPLIEVAAFALPDATARFAADLAGNLALDHGQLAISALAGTFAGTGAKGDLAIDFGADAAKPRIKGTLAFDHLSANALTSLALGPPQPAAKGAIWSTARLGAALKSVPTTDLVLSAAAFDLAPSATGRDARLDLSLAPGTLALSDIDMKFDDGRLGGHLTLRRDGAAALVAGSLEADGLAFHTPYASAKASGTLDFTATGESEAALAASLVGTGKLRLAGATVENSDPGALARIIAATDEGTLAVDEPEVRSALGGELDRSALSLDDAAYDANMAAGVLRLTPAASASVPPRPGAPALTASLNLQSASIEARLVLTSQTLPRDWTGPPAQAALVWRGPIGSATRDLDSAGFFNALAARALVREAARIDMFEQDIRERAYFNRYAKGLQFMRRRGQEIAAFEAARRAAEQARQAEAQAPAATLAPADQTSHGLPLAPPAAPPRPLDLHPTAAPAQNPAAPP